MQSVRPFENHGNYTQIHNALLDAIMPVISPSAWTLLCLMIRQTRGWQRIEQGMSYRQLLEGTGFGSRTTVANALNELLERDLIVVRPSSDKFEPFMYAINTDVQIEWEPRDFADTGTKSVPAQKTTGTESVLGTGTESVPAQGESSGTENGLINRKEESYLNKEKKEESTPADLFGQMFNTTVSLHVKEVLNCAGITNLVAWQSVLQRWKTNGYSTRNLDGMIQAYQEKASKDKSDLPARKAPAFTEPPNWNQMSNWDRKKYKDNWYKTAFSTV